MSVTRGRSLPSKLRIVAFKAAVGTQSSNCQRTAGLFSKKGREGQLRPAVPFPKGMVGVRFSQEARGFYCKRRRLQVPNTARPPGSGTIAAFRDRCARDRQTCSPVSRRARCESGWPSHTCRFLSHTCLASEHLRYSRAQGRSTAPLGDDFGNRSKGRASSEPESLLGIFQYPIRRAGDRFDV
jgi:hypothetical protein